MELSKDQTQAFEFYKTGRNVFISGPGGAGKTELIKRIVEDASSVNRSVQVCAMTGCAALLLNCGAKTIHLWSGIKRMRQKWKKKRMRRMKRHRRKMRNRSK